MNRNIFDVTKKSKYHKLNLLKLGWNRNGKLDLTYINCLYRLKDSINKIEYAENWLNSKYKNEFIADECTFCNLIYNEIIRKTKC